MKYLDAHTHVHFAAFKEDSDAVIKRALAAGVGMITVGTQRDTSRAAVEVARKYDGVWATVGLHPIHTSRSFHDAQELGAPESEKGFTPTPERESGNSNSNSRLVRGFTSRGEDFDYNYYLELGRDPKAVAVGECGLDYFRIEGNIEEGKAKQKAALEAQIKLAHELGKPLMVHCRDAFADLTDMLRERKNLLLENPGVIHFFTGTPDDARNLLDLGFAFTFGGVITFTRDYDGAIGLIPRDRILSETDAPYVAPAPYRGKRNEPVYLVETVKKLAELKDLPLENMKEQILENARRIFSVG